MDPPIAPAGSNARRQLKRRVDDSYYGDNKSKNCRNNPRASASSAINNLVEILGNNSQTSVMTQMMQMQAQQFQAMQQQSQQSMQSMMMMIMMMNKNSSMPNVWTSPMMTSSSSSSSNNYNDNNTFNNNSSNVNDINNNAIDEIDNFALTQAFELNKK